ncbi:MAG: hypothetical protein KDK45_14085, partial [Leptospiraceae bacterium]|nr:hypothetical protein [Leptospiraceae bacterium]
YNYERAEKYLRKVLDKEPENQTAIQLSKDVMYS